MSDRQRITRTAEFPAWLFLIVMTLVYEAFLYLGTADQFLAARFATIMIFALAFGCVLGLILSFFSPKIQKTGTLVLLAVMALLYIVQYFIHDAYQVFMPFDGVLGGAGNVATNYLDVVLGLLSRNLWKILLLILPLIFYGKFVKAPKTSAIARLCLCAAVVCMYLSGFTLVHRFNIDAEKFDPGTTFDNAVSSFGLNVGLGFELLQSDDEDLAFSQIEIDPDIPQTQPSTEAPADQQRVFNPHQLDLDFAAMAANEKNEKVAVIHSYIASQKPAMENEYTGLFEGKNLIFITAEAFSCQAVDKDRTPTLYRMMTEGIYFTDYYQPVWGAGTTGGEYSNLLSMVPYGSTTSMQEVTQQNFFHTIGKQLQARGYSSAAFHNNDHTYYNRHQTHTHLGYDIFMGYGNGMEQGVSPMWPESDEEMFRFTIPQYIDKQPFSLYYMTVSGHSIYLYSAHEPAQKNWDAVKDLDYSEPVKTYLAGNMELELSMAYLLEQLEEKGIMDDTVVVIAADHYPYGLAPSDTWGTDKNYLEELLGQKIMDSFTQDQSPLIIWSGCLEDLDLQVDTPVMSLDILPTLSNLFGVEYDSRLMCGRDALSDEMPLAFWLDGSWKTDKGSYNSFRGVFTPAEGVVVDEDYPNRIRSIINNKLNLSKAVVHYDYFNYIAAELEKLNTGS